MIQHLAKNHSVVGASLAGSAEELHQGQGLARYATEVIAEVEPPIARWRRAIGALATSTPSSVAYFWSPRLRQRVHEAARLIRFDAVVVHCAFVANYATAVASPVRVLDFGDLDSWKWSAYARQ